MAEAAASFKPVWSLPKQIGTHTTAKVIMWLNATDLSIQPNTPKSNFWTAHLATNCLVNRTKTPM